MEKSKLNTRALNANKNIISRKYWEAYLKGFEYETYFQGAIGQYKEEKTDVMSFPVPNKLFDELDALANSDKAKHIILITALGILAQKYSSKTDIGIMTPVYASETAEPDTVNSIVVRVQDFSLLTFKQLLTKVREAIIENFKHSNYPLELMLNEGESELKEIQILGLCVEGNQSKYTSAQRSPQLVFSFILNASAPLLKITARNKELNESYTNILAKHYLHLLSELINQREVQIKTIELLTEEEQNTILNTFNASDHLFEQKETVISLFEMQALDTPDQVAIRYGNSEVTYKALKEQSDKVAHFLINHYRVMPGELVGVMLKREMALIPVIFGIMKARAVYVPIDPDYPADRTNFILEDTTLNILISRSAYFPAGENPGLRIVNLDSHQHDIDEVSTDTKLQNVQGGDPAYVIYTSGSTGVPRGVMVAHRSLANIIQSMDKRYPLNSPDCYLFKTTYTFDVSLVEIFGWMLHGGTLSMLRPGEESIPSKIVENIETNKITHINFVPSMFSLFLTYLEKESSARINSLKYIFLAGEVLPPTLVQRFQALNTAVALKNVYGPTEATIYASAYNIEGRNADSIPIGKPLDNVKLYILNRDLNFLPVGVAGELCIGGTAPALGYKNDEVGTKEKFLNHKKLSSQTLYRTGDMAKWLPDGNIELIGRMDSQVKVRGYRVELGEIEYQLAKHEAVGSCVVLKPEKEQYLVAYYISNATIEDDGLKSYLSSQLPAYMVPAFFVKMKQFPLTASGKVDKKSLPNPKSYMNRPVIPPANEIQQEIIEIWAEVLEIKTIQIGTNMSFFDIGGDSLKLISMIDKINDQFGTELTPSQLFKLTTILQIASHIMDKDENTLGAEAGIEDELEQRSNAFKLFENL